jgi:hypothetical protein
MTTPRDGESVPTAPKKPLIFISYAHADEPERPAEGEIKWLSFVTGYLRPAMKHGAVDIWLDRLMPGGANWEREMEPKLRACDIFILLVSRHSLSSDYVVDKEVALIRDRQTNGEDVHFYPLVLTPTPKIALDLVRDVNLRPRDGKPLSDYSINERYRQMSDAADEIVAIADEVGGSKKVRERSETRIATSTSVGTATAPAQNLRTGDRPAPASDKTISRLIKRISFREVDSHVGPIAPQNIVTVPELRMALAEAFGGETREAAIVTAVRAALRVLPLAAEHIVKEPRLAAAVPVDAITSALLRTVAISWVSATYPNNSDRLGGTAFAARTDLNLCRSRLPVGYDKRTVAINNAVGVALTASTAVERSTDAADVGVAAAFGSVNAASHVSLALSESVLNEVLFDISTITTRAAAEVVTMPLWSASPELGPWTAVKAALSTGGDWDVWIDWYDERLRGGSRGEDYELVFASVPDGEWAKGPAAANAWIKAHLPAEELQGINDALSLEDWLNTQSRETAIAIAVRAALRTAALVVRATRGRALARREQREIANFAGAVFRAVACASASAKYASPAYDSTDLARAVDSANAAMRSALPSKNFPEAVALAISAAATSAATAAAAPSARAKAAAASAGSFVNAFASADASVSKFDATRIAWEHVAADVESAKQIGSHALLDSPIWLRDEPRWARPAFESLAAALPDGEDWDVWLGWYQERLRGGSRGEGYELPFASVPQEEWDKGPTAANIWIREHLPLSVQGQIRVQDSLDAQVIRADDLKELERRTTPSELPPPLPDVDSPFTYGWNPKLRVEVIAGAQNLPFYRFFRSEEEHRKTLESCRIGADRLLKSLRDRNYGNSVPRAYAERLAYYVEDLPRAAGVGNILLANDQGRILHDMFLADADMLPADFASALKAVIANQFALNDFYDLVRRHNEAVNSGNWRQPFPFEAAQSFFGAVEDNTPDLFEREVGEGLRQVEQAVSPASRAPELTSGVAAAVGPPPLPPGTPNAEHSRQRQIATAANALWAVFLKGKDLPVALEGWTQAAHRLGENIGPILDFLRRLGAPS